MGYIGNFLYYLVFFRKLVFVYRFGVGFLSEEGGSSDILLVLMRFGVWVVVCRGVRDFGEF